MEQAHCYVVSMLVAPGCLRPRSCLAERFPESDEADEFVERDWASLVAGEQSVEQHPPSLDGNGPEDGYQGEVLWGPVS